MAWEGKGPRFLPGWARQDASGVDVRDAPLLIAVEARSNLPLRAPRHHSSLIVASTGPAHAVDSATAARPDGAPEAHATRRVRRGMNA